MLEPLGAVDIVAGYGLGDQARNATCTLWWAT